MDGINIPIFCYSVCMHISNRRVYILYNYIYHYILYIYVYRYIFIHIKTYYVPYACSKKKTITQASFGIFVFRAGAERAEFVEHGMGTCEVAAEQGGADAAPRLPEESSGPVLGQFFWPGFNWENFWVNCNWELYQQYMGIKWNKWDYIANHGIIDDNRW